jgi:hypothetical protein
MKGKIQYHHKSKQASIDRGNPQILTSSPILENDKKTKMKIPEFLLESKMRLVIKNRKFNNFLFILGGWGFDLRRKYEF